MHDRNDTAETIEICFEVGHSSTIRSKPTTNHNPPRTHDWKIFLRSADIHGDLNCLIQRCVFHLHPEFPNPIRELLTTPFAIQESGYAGFCLPIEIYFKTKKEPRKFLIEYDLDLHHNREGHPYRQKESYLRKYRCSFYDSDREFREKLLAAGGKIVDSGPISSNHTDLDDSNMNGEQTSPHNQIIRHSPQQKRPISPVNTSNTVNKKPRLEQPTNNSKKKPVQSVIKTENSDKSIVNTKKPKLVTSKTSSISEEKMLKTSITKELNQSSTVSEKSKKSLILKPRTSAILTKSHSLNDMKLSSQSIPVNMKKNEVVVSPSKSKTVINSQTISKKSITKNPQKKTSIKTEQISTSMVKSPSTIVIKQESLSQPSTTTSVSINTLKKIPKKLVSSSTSLAEKRSRLSMPSASLDRNSTRKLKRQDSLSSKTKPSLNREHSFSSPNTVNSNNNKQSEKKKIVKDSKLSQSSKYNLPPLSSNHRKTIPSKSTRTPSPVLHEASVISLSSPPSDISQPYSISSPSVQIFQNENTPLQSSIDIDTQLSDKSNSRDQTLIKTTTTTTNQICYSDQSEDANESDTSQNDDDDDDDNNNNNNDQDGDEEDADDEDLPSILTNDDLRYKLIYIYNRFQLNSINDLTIFVRFFKRHQLIDISTLSMTKASDEMFTYDLFSLSPSHIGELANDLGYTTTTTSIVNSLEQ